MQSLRTALMAVLVMFVFRNALGQAIHVPDERPTITLGIAAAVPNQNWVVVSNADQYDPSVPYSEVITMVSGVAVLAAEGETPIIDAGNLATTAVTWPATASSNTRLEGFTVRGGTQKVLYVRDQGVVRDCVIDNEGTAGLTKGIESSGNTIIDGCTVTMSGNQVNYGISQSADEDWATIIDCNVTVTGDQDNDSGISFSGGSPNIVNCTVDVARGTGIYISCPTSTTLGNLQGCSVSMGYGFGVYLLNGDITVSDVNVNFYHSDYYNAGITCGSGSGTSRIDVGNCLVSVPGGVGVFVLDDYANVHNVTVDNVGTGFVCDNDVDPTITGCIVTDYTDSYAFEGVNAVYCIGDGTTPYGSGTQGTGSVIQDPLYCNESAGEYTLRVDSYGNPGVNDNLLIGAFPVACMFGTLARTCEFEGNGTLYVPGDVTVPSQKTLTLNDATVLKIRTADSLGIGSDDDKVELVVSSGGTLNISGSGGNPVVLTSDDAPPAEGDWWGIMVNSGGAAHIDYAHIEYSDYGVRYLSSTSGNISHSLFGYNTNYDIAAGSGTGAMALTIDADTIGVGGGKGIDLASYVRGLTIQNTRIIGDSPPVYSTAGIFFESMTSGEYPAISGNFIQSFQSGYGISAAAAEPRIEQNEIAYCGYGIQTTSGTALVGSASISSSDNLIHNNYVGIRVNGGTAKIRNNQITDNAVGVLNGSSGNADLGTSLNDLGKNTFLGNTNYCMENDNTSITLRAQGNYCGSCNPNPPTCWTGNVDTDNYRCQPPAGVDWAVESLPSRFVVHGLSPNPMRSAGLITFSLPEASEKVQVRILDLAGRVVRDFGRFAAGPGREEVAWDGRDEQGVGVVSGIYFIQVQAGNHKSEAVKALVVR